MLLSTHFMSKINSVLVCLLIRSDFLSAAFKFDPLFSDSIYKNKVVKLVNVTFAYHQHVDIVTLVLLSMLACQCQLLV